MPELCVNGHVRTEENTRWSRYGKGDKTRPRCTDCRKQGGKATVATVDWSRKRTDDKHEDIEDLLRFGATFNEIVQRGGYSTWKNLRQSLVLRNRVDLITALEQKKRNA